MINTIEAYKQCGHNCGRAHRIQDTGLYDFERRWYIAALGYEKPQDKADAMAAYKAGYNEGRGL